MSVEEAVTEALNKPIDNNDAATEDANKLLAEIEAEGNAPEVKQDESATDATNGNHAKNGESSKDDADTMHKRDEDDDDDGYRRRDRGDGGRGRGAGRGRGGRGRGNFRGGIKSVVTREEKSDDHDAIRKQMEFYFSDSNLPQDKFLFEKVGGTENHPVEISLLRTFKRMRHFEPLEAIVEALRSSTVLQLTDDDTKVQRRQPLSDTHAEGPNMDHVQIYEDKAMPRSVYVKGFGSEVPSTQFDIEAWFAQYGPTNAVRLRRADDKAFKGSVFAEFETEDQATKFLELDPKPKYNEKEMQIMSKKEYCEKKVEDIKSGKIRPGTDRDFPPRDDRRSSRGRGDRHNNKGRRGDNDDRDWRTRRDEDRKNGFKDDRRRGDRDRRDRGGRDRRVSNEVDERGVPVIKTAPETDREKSRADAIAKARAAVDDTKKDKENDASEPAVAEDNKKREREEEDHTDEPAAKKVDVKTDA